MLNKIRQFISNLIGIDLILNENYVIKFHFHQKNSKIWRVGYRNPLDSFNFFCHLIIEDISSISGSDSSNDELSDNEGSLITSLDGSYNSCARNNPKIIFTLNDGRHLSLYRCLLHGKKVLKNLHHIKIIIIIIVTIFRIFLKNPKN